MNKKKGAALIAALVSGAAVAGIEIDNEQAEAAKNAIGSVITGGGVLYAFGSDLWAKVQAKFRS